MVQRLAKRLLSVLLKHKDINTSQLCLYTFSYFSFSSILFLHFTVFWHLTFYCTVPAFFCILHSLPFPNLIFLLHCLSSPAYFDIPDQQTRRPGGAHLPKGQYALKCRASRWVLSYKLWHAWITCWFDRVEKQMLGRSYFWFQRFWKGCQTFWKRKFFEASSEVVASLH